MAHYPSSHGVLAKRRGSPCARGDVTAALALSSHTPSGRWAPKTEESPRQMLIARESDVASR